MSACASCPVAAELRAEVARWKGFSRLHEQRARELRRLQRPAENTVPVPRPAAAAPGACPNREVINR